MTERPTCDDCGDEMDLVAGDASGQGLMDHCWRCWYQAHPERLPNDTKEQR